LTGNPIGVNHGDTTGLERRAVANGAPSLVS
jgi:hypothetical protein